MRKKVKAAKNAVQTTQMQSVTNSAQSCGSSFMRLIFLAIVSSGFIFIFFLLFVASSTDVLPIFELAKFPVAAYRTCDVVCEKVHLNFSGFCSITGDGGIRGCRGARGGLSGLCGGGCWLSRLFFQ